MTTIIECPACSTRYKMTKAIPEGGRSVKCARCGHQWRITPEEPEELVEALDDEAEEQAPSAPHEQPHTPMSAAQAAFRTDPASAEPAAQTIGDAWDVRPDDLAAAVQAEARAASPPEAPQTIADAWDVRRGHLAAAIASMSVPADTMSEETAAGRDPRSPQMRPSWQGEEESGSQNFTTDAGGFGADTESTAPFASALGARAQAEDAAPAADSSSAWEARSTWMTDPARTDDSSDDLDPENSVRRALRAAIEDSDEGEADHFDPGAVHSSMSRPVFAESPSFEDTMASVAAGAASDNANEPLLRFKDAPDDGETVADALASRGPDRTPMGGLFGAPDTDAALDSNDKFENDIVGIFRQQLQEKRSFGPAPRQKGAEDDFTDYDRDFAGGSEQADERYMADSALDADAAALQAALEGSLRERHAASEGGGGGLALAAAWAVFLSVLSGVTLAFINFRDDIVAALPGTVALYRTIGFDVAQRQIDFGGVSYRWTTAEGKPMIEVTGQIINLTDREIAVPRVLVNVHDKANVDTVKATATIRTEPLGAGETAEFTLEFLSPPKTISQIELAFAEID